MSGHFVEFEFEGGSCDLKTIEAADVPYENLMRTLSPDAAKDLITRIQAEISDKGCAKLTEKQVEIMLPLVGNWLCEAYCSGLEDLASIMDGKGGVVTAIFRAFKQISDEHRCVVRKVKATRF